MDGSKFLFFVLLISTALFAQSQASISTALSGLCSTTKSFVSIGVLVFAIFALPTIIAGSVLFYLKKDNPNLRRIGKILIWVGVVEFTFLVIGILIYLFTPSLISAIVGEGATVGC